MIPENEIESKDFYCALSAIVGKLNLIYDTNEVDGEEGMAIQYILEESMTDLRMIQKTLYGKDFGTKGGKND